MRLLSGVDIRPDGALQTVDLGAALARGRHAIRVTFSGRGSLAYQLGGRWYQPRDVAGTDAVDRDLSVDNVLDESSVAKGALVYQTVAVRARRALDMPIVTAGVPPGFDVDTDALDELVRARRVDKVQRTAREVVFYLHEIAAGQQLQLPLRLTARLPGRVAVPPATVYEYYRPERRAAGPARSLHVDG